MGKVWDLVEQHQNSQVYETSVRSIAKAAGIGPSTFAKWQTLRRLPTPEHLRAVARQINVPYRVLLEAALMDAGYLEETRNAAPTTQAAGSAATIEQFNARRHRPTPRPQTKAARRGKPDQLGDE